MTIKKPTKLGPAGARLWDDVADENELRPDEQRVLEDAAREADIISLLEDAMRGEVSKGKLLVKGSMGQDAINPLVSELRQHRATLAQLLRQLKLGDGETSAEISHKARAAVNARWARRTA